MPSIPKMLSCRSSDVTPPPEENTPNEMQIESVQNMPQTPITNQSSSPAQRMFQAQVVPTINEIQPFYPQRNPEGENEHVEESLPLTPGFAYSPNLQEFNLQEGASLLPFPLDTSPHHDLEDSETTKNRNEREQATTSLNFGSVPNVNPPTDLNVLAEELSNIFHVSSQSLLSPGYQNADEMMSNIRQINRVSLPQIGVSPEASAPVIDSASTFALDPFQGTDYDEFVFTEDEIREQFEIESKINNRNRIPEDKYKQELKLYFQADQTNRTDDIKRYIQPEITSNWATRIALLINKEKPETQDDIYSCISKGFEHYILLKVHKKRHIEIKKENMEALRRLFCKEIFVALDEVTLNKIDAGTDALTVRNTQANTRPGKRKLEDINSEETHTPNIYIPSPNKKNKNVHFLDERDLSVKDEAPSHSLSALALALEISLNQPLGSIPVDKNSTEETLLAAAAALGIKYNVPEGAVSLIPRINPEESDIANLDDFDD